MKEVSSAMPLRGWESQAGLPAEKQELGIEERDCYAAWVY